jgi:hypothetical protein
MALESWPMEIEIRGIYFGVIEDPPVALIWLFELVKVLAKYLVNYILHTCLSHGNEDAFSLAVEHWE